MKLQITSNFKLCFIYLKKILNICMRKRERERLILFYSSIAQHHWDCAGPMLRAWISISAPHAQCESIYLNRHDFYSGSTLLDSCVQKLKPGVKHRYSHLGRGHLIPCPTYYTVHFLLPYEAYISNFS